MVVESKSGDKELRAAVAESQKLFLAVGFFSIFVNILMLTGPLFMLQVYDRVLTSRSEATLVTLVVITAFLFLMVGVLDYARGRVLARAGARFQARLDARVFKAVLTRSIAPAERARPAMGVRDLETIQRFASGNGPFAFFDAPWTPIFLCVLFLFHWLLGLLAVFSGLLLLALALINQARTGHLQREVGEAQAHSSHFIEQMRYGSETIKGLGMQNSVVEQSGKLRTELLNRTLVASDRTGFFGVTTKTLRLFLQSMMLGLGAALAIKGEVTFGIIIAGSILLGRALAPIDQAVAQWPLLQRVLISRRSLIKLLNETPSDQTLTVLPPPKAKLEVRGLTVVAPGAKIPAVRGASFQLGPGQAVGIAGASASGKSTLARAMAGIYTPLGGTVRIDGAELEQYGPDLGKYIGYLPQEVLLFDGTVAQNISRFSPDSKDEDIIRAAKRTGSHDMILKLPGGYDFQVSAGGAALSGGQRQRIGLARAFYGDPVLVIMDEPDSNLDAEGTMALARAVEDQKKRGGAAVIVAHRHGAFAQCDMVLVMDGGRPIPATKGKKKQPLRKLDKSPQGDERDKISADQTPAQDATRVTAKAGNSRFKESSSNQVQRTAQSSEKANLKPPPDFPSREQQIADAVARITNFRIGQEESNFNQNLSNQEGNNLSVIQGSGGEINS
ncbi:MAG: type I secretion system permease/ATPase [Paracoccaceae bacterium]|nr:type I secretion system permease/ATPase [Paracoccaceae bacterium]MDE2916027.1 type I secretion system permease/ATPase [Paracoccaceae bacterium]